MDLNENEFSQKTLIPLENFCFLPLTPSDLRSEGLYSLILFYFIFDNFEKIYEISQKFINFQIKPMNSSRILYNHKKLMSMITIAKGVMNLNSNISKNINEIAIIVENNKQIISFEKDQNNEKIEIDEEPDVSYGNFTFIESQEIFQLDKKSEISLDPQQFLPSDRLKASNRLLLEAFIQEDYEMLRKVNEEYEFLIKEHSEKKIEETPLLSDPYIGLLIVNLFKTNNSGLKLSDLLESFSLVIELHGIPHWEKFILLLHSCEKIIQEYEGKKAGVMVEKTIEIEEENEKVKLYNDVLTGYKKIMGIVFLKLKKIRSEEKDTSFNNKFLLGLFKEYLKPNNDGNEVHSDLIISLAICYVYLEIKIAIHAGKGGTNTINLKIFLTFFWNFLQILKNTKKYDIIKNFFYSITCNETLNFLKSMLSYFLISFKHYYHNTQDLEIKESQNIFTFNPMNSVNFEENYEFKQMNNLLKGDTKNRLKFDDYESDKAIILHYFKLVFKREKEICRLMALREKIEDKEEVQIFAKQKKTLVEKIKLYFLMFDYKKSLKYF